MAATSTGIFIGKNYVDAVTLSGSYGRPVIIDSARTQITLPVTEETWMAALRNTISSLKIKPDKIFSALPESGMMLRHFDMPLLPGSEQAQAIKFEARKYIPFKLDEIFSDYKVINILKEKKRMHVLFIAAQKADVEAQLKIFQACDIKLVGLDITPIALLRVINAGRYFKNGEIVAFLQLSPLESIASINIIEDNFPTISRDIPIAQQPEALAERLTSELRLSFDYYKRKDFHGTVSRLIICGKPNLSELGKKISEELGVVAEMAPHDNVIKSLTADNLGTMIAAGAAMNGLGHDTHGINLLPESSKPKNVMPQKQQVLPFVIAALMILLTFFYSTKIVSSAKSKFDVALGAATALPPGTQNLSVDVLESLKQDQIKTISFAKSLEENRVYLTEKLNRIAQSLPEGAWISSFEITELPNSTMQMIINGKVFLPKSSQQMSSVNRFLETLKQDKVFMEGFVYCEVENLRKDHVDDFDITSFSIRCGGS